MANFKVVGEAYAIRHIPTHTYMPETKHGRGYTAVEVEEFKPFGSRLPRLLDSRKAAHLALKAWLKGAWEREYDDEGFGRYVVGANPPKVAPANRKAEEMEIVEFEVVEK